ncbi:Glypican-6 [Oopsacas minuta]|uniref:Glypican-6 n=1 Tax=Oopsacas minuta TaxID=111878 RepID=A0AAV7JXC8_9METZ|nr:Glypican-6 [Oopsacas minuta]
MNFYIKYWFYIASLLLILTESADEPSCTNTIEYVRHHEPDLLYIHEAGIPYICGLDASNCCQSKVERRLLIRTHQNITNALTKVKSNTLRDFNNYDTLIDAYEYTVEKSKQEYSDYFYSTFGLHYYKYIQPADTLFEYFKDFTYGQNIDLLPAELHDFFANQFLASVKEFLYLEQVSPSYQQCIRSVYRRYVKLAEYSELYMYLNNILTKLSLVLKARESLHRIVDHIRRDNSMLSGEECPASLMRMSTCQLCDGYKSLSPCRDLCLNTVGGCLAPLMRLEDPLLYQYKILKQLATQFANDFNEFEQQLKKLTISTMEFIFRLHVNSRKIVGQIKSNCAIDTSSRYKRIVDHSPQEWRRSAYNIVYSSQPSNTIQLQTALDEFLISFDRVVSFLHDLPDKTCQSLGAARGNSNCWNGNDRGKYRLGVVGTDRLAQLKNPAISLTSNSFITYQADYEGVKQVTYSLQKFVQLSACFIDDYECINNIPLCSEVSPTSETIPMSGMGEMSGDGDLYLDEEDEGWGEDTTDQYLDTKSELYYSGNGDYQDPSYRRKGAYYNIAKSMPNTVVTCLPPGFVATERYTTTNDPSTSSTQTTPDLIKEFNIDTENSTIHNASYKNTNSLLLLLAMVVCMLSIF